MEAVQKSEISHQGTIESIEDKHFNVRIISMASCVSCSASGTCSASDIAEKIVEVIRPANTSHKVGDFVTIILDQSMGLKAVFLGYVAPFLVLFFTLLAMLGLGYSEGIGGLTALLMLIPYFAVMYVFKDKIKESFTFRLKY
ncbi:MAG: RseC/MucC family positive regulator of sigma(E) [Bacteroidetes bacterium]|nr:MAG: RseC/MucC family positive regulator of sigma(E) [Bacteroidota bacterium]